MVFPKNYYQNPGRKHPLNISRFLTKRNSPLSKVTGAWRQHASFAIPQLGKNFMFAVGRRFPRPFDRIWMNYRSSYTLLARRFFLISEFGISQAIRNGTAMRRLVISQRCSTKDTLLKISCERLVTVLKGCFEMRSHTEFCNRRK